MQNGAAMLPTRPTVLPLPTASDLETRRGLIQQQEQKTRKAQVAESEGTAAQSPCPPFQQRINSKT